MYTRVISEATRYQFNLIEKLTFRLPQNAPAVQRIQDVKIELVNGEHHTLLDLIVLEAVVEVQITYLGIDHLFHTLVEEVSFMRTVEMPKGQVTNFTCLDKKYQSDYQLILPRGNEQRVRQFEIIFLLRLFYELGFTRQSYEPYSPKRRSQYRAKGSFERRRPDRTAVREKKYPWKRICYSE